MELKIQKSSLFGWGRFVKSQVDNRKYLLGVNIYCSYNQKSRVWEISKDRVHVDGKMYLQYKMEGNNTTQLTNQPTKILAKNKKQSKTLVSSVSND